MSVQAVASLRTRAVQVPVMLVGLGHGGTHWIAATFYLVLPFVTRDLGLSYAQAGVIASCFHIGSALANVPSGTLVDLTGRRVLFQAISLLVGGAALFLFGMSRAYPMFCLLVGVIGTTNMLWHPAAISFLSNHLPRNRGYALSIHSLGAHIGDALAPLAAGWMLLYLSWHGTVQINALIGMLPVIPLLAVLGRGDGEARAAAKATDLGTYFKSFIEIARTRAMWSLCLMAGFRTMMQTGLLLYLPFYLANVLKFDPFWMGVALMVLQLGGMVAAPIAGVVSDRIGRRPVVLAGMSLTTLMIIGLTFIGNATVYVAAIAVLGFVMYAMRPVIHSWLMDRSPPHLAATMTGAMFGTQAVLSALTPVIGGLIADRFGLLAVFYFLAASVLVANLLALAVPRTEHGS
jgi:MFS family permease